MAAEHLTDDEIFDTYLEGPLALAKHSETKAHLHLVHDRCPVCAEKLALAVLFGALVAPR